MSDGSQTAREPWPWPVSTGIVVRGGLAAGKRLPEIDVDKDVIAAWDPDDAELRPTSVTRMTGRHPLPRAVL